MQNRVSACFSPVDSSCLHLFYHLVQDNLTAAARGKDLEDGAIYPWSPVASNPPSGKWMFPKIKVPQNGWFIMENPIKMDDLEGTPIFGNTQMKVYLKEFAIKHVLILGGRSKSPVDEMPIFKASGMGYQCQPLVRSLKMQHDAKIDSDTVLRMTRKLRSQM